LKEGVAGALGRWYFGPMVHPEQTRNENNAYLQCRVISRHSGLPRPE
jgi:hypothetical protein